MKFKIQFKRFFAIILSCFMIVVAFVFPVVSRADDSPDTPVSTTRTYSYDYVVPSHWFSVSGGYQVEFRKGLFTLQAGKIMCSYLVPVERDGADCNMEYFLVYDFNTGEFSDSVSPNVLSANWYRKNTIYKENVEDRSGASSYYYEQTGADPTFQRTSYFDLDLSDVMGATYVYNKPHVKVDWPVFTSKESARSYLLGEIDLSSAVNSDDLLTYDSTMPHVENAYISYEKVEVNQGKKWKFNTNLHFDFPESAVGMTAEIYMIGSVRCVHTIPFSSKVDTLIINTPNLKYGSVPYQNTSYETGIRSVSEELFNGQTMFDIVLNSQEYADWESNRGFMSGAINTLDKMTYCVRLVDSSHTGDWVRCSIDLNGAQSTEIIGVGGGGATEDVAGGTTEIVDGDTSADDVVSGGGSVKDSYDVAPDKNIDVSLDSSNLLETVKQIFSDNGLVGIVKAIFGWMPIWMVAFISLFFTMLIALLIYRVVRG